MLHGRLRTKLTLEGGHSIEEVLRRFLNQLSRAIQDTEEVLCIDKDSCHAQFCIELLRANLESAEQHREGTFSARVERVLAGISTARFESRRQRKTKLRDDQNRDLMNILHNEDDQVSEGVVLIHSSIIRTAIHSVSVTGMQDYVTHIMHSLFDNVNAIGRLSATRSAISFTLTDDPQSAKCSLSKHQFVNIGLRIVQIAGILDTPALLPHPTIINVISPTKFKVLCDFEFVATSPPFSSYAFEDFKLDVVNDQANDFEKHKGAEHEAFESHDGHEFIEADSREGDALFFGWHVDPERVAAWAPVDSPQVDVAFKSAIIQVVLASYMPWTLNALKPMFCAKVGESAMTLVSSVVSCA